MKINRLAITPMPLLHPGSATLSASISTTEKIKGVIKADVKILRIVSGIKLPINCYIHEGEYIGSWFVPEIDDDDLLRFLFPSAHTLTCAP